MNYLSTFKGNISTRLKSLPVNNFLVLSLFLLIAVNPVSGQAPDTLWSKLYRPEGIMGMETIGMFYSGHVTPDNGFIAVGMTVNPYVKAYLVRTNGNGDTLWTKQYFDDPLTYGSFSCPSVQLTSDGGYILGGFGTGQIWLLKVNSSGDTLWSRSYGNSFDSAYVVHELKITPDNGYILIGTVGVISASDIFILKTDSNGNQQWYSTYSLSEGYDQGYSIVEDNTGGFIFSALCNTPDTVVVVKITETGSLLWTTQYPQVEFADDFQCLKKTDDGNYILAGGNGNFYIIKFDESGAVLNYKEYGNFSGGQYFEEDCNSIFQTNDGGYILCGHSDIDYNGAYELWLLKVDANIEEQWSRMVSCTNNDHTAPQVEQTANGDYIIFSSTRLDPSGFNYGLMIRLGFGGTSVSSESGNADNFILQQNYPNPFNPVTTIAFTIPERSFVSLKIFDIAGNEIEILLEGVYNAGTHRVNWNPGQIASGTYFYSLKAKDYYAVKKLILCK